MELLANINKNAEDIATNATLIAKNATSINNNAEAIALEHAKGAELSLENATTGMTAPFHKGAARYFAEKGITVTAE